jgi:hypothetical protein
MKKLLTLALLVATTFLSCKKDDDEPVAGSGSSSLTVEKKNKALVIYFGEDWCGPCGSAGGPSLDTALSQEGISLTGLKINSDSNNDTLNWQPGNQMFFDFSSTIFQSNGIPAMAVNNTKQLVSSSLGSNYNSILAKANQFVADSVTAGIALNKVIIGDSIKINTKVKFFKAQNAGVQFKLAVYLVEDDVISSQIGSSNPNYEHRNQVRIANGSNSYLGVPLNNSDPISINQEFSNTFTLGLKPYWKRNKIKVIGVIWKSGSTPYKVVNSNVVL